MAEFAVMVGFILALIVLFLPKLRHDAAWKATITPLASIIGSGFLVVIPLFGHTLGSFAPLAMAAVLGLSYGIGHVMRFNIRHLEGISEEHRVLKKAEFLSSLILALAYFVSVAFYLMLLASFVLTSLNIHSPTGEKIVASAILATIGIIGWVWGLRFLENLEQYAVSIKLAIIVGLVLGWAVLDVHILSSGVGIYRAPMDQDILAVLKVIGGSLLVVQGFETSRYLASAYDAELRIRSMRYAQWIAIGIYMIFILVCLPSFKDLPDQIQESAIIELSSRVGVVLPVLLVAAAVMSQFSAAVADTIGSSGLIVESLGELVTIPNENGPRVGYVVVALIGIVLMWMTNIFNIIAIASRCFAAYYFVQTAMATSYSFRSNRIRYGKGQAVFFAGLGCVLLWIVLCGTSAEAAP